MKILYLYLARESLRYFVIILSMVIGIYIAVDFFEKIDDFMETGVPISRALLYFLLKIPSIVAQIIPVCVMLTLVILFGMMNRNNEIVALKSNGISVYSLFKPALFAGIGSCMVLFFLAEAVVPLTMAKANRIWLGEVRKKPVMISKTKNIWIKDNRSITHIKYYNSAKNTLSGVTINYFGNNFKLVGRIDAEKGFFHQGKWILQSVMEQKFDPSRDNHVVEFYDEKETDLGYRPDDFNRVVKKADEMNIFELMAYIRRVEDEGYDATHYRVDLNAKIAFPVICIIMSMVGTGIAVNHKIKDALPVAVAIGIGIVFVFWIFYSFCLSLGYGEMLPPFIAAWAANIVFLCFGGLALIYAE
jgi:lipopolysaccharide export system permease protein